MLGWGFDLGGRGRELHRYFPKQESSMKSLDKFEGDFFFWRHVSQFSLIDRNVGNGKKLNPDRENVASRRCHFWINLINLFLRCRQAR